MVEEKLEETRAPEDLADIDARLKETSQALITEMDRLIRRAKILQLEHKAIVQKRLTNFKRGKRLI